MSDNNAREMAETQKNIYRQKTDMAMAGTDTAKKRRSAIAIMRSLIGLVKPLLHIMVAAILLGTVGYLCAIFLTILAGQVILHGSCSHFMDYELFTRTIGQAAKNVHKRLRQVEYRTQAPDHPILWAADESYYLKFYIFQVCEEA